MCTDIVATANANVFCIENDQFLWFTNVSGKTAEMAYLPIFDHPEPNNNNYVNNPHGSHCSPIVRTVQRVPLRPLSDLLVTVVLIVSLARPRRLTKQLTPKTVYTHPCLIEYKSGLNIDRGMRRQNTCSIWVVELYSFPHNYSTTIPESAKLALFF